MRSHPRHTRAHWAVHQAYVMNHNRQQVIDWVRRAVATDPTGWAEVLDTVADVLAYVHTRKRTGPPLPETVGQWPVESVVVAAFLQRAAIDGAGVWPSTVVDEAHRNGLRRVGAIYLATAPDLLEDETGAARLAGLLDGATPTDTVAMVCGIAAALHLLGATASQVRELADTAR